MFSVQMKYITEYTGQIVMFKIKLEKLRDGNCLPSGQLQNYACWFISYIESIPRRTKSCYGDSVSHLMNVGRSVAFKPL